MDDPKYPRCEICNFPATHSYNGDKTHCDCLRCGRFSFTGSVQAKLLSAIPSRVGANMSGFLRENSPIDIDTQNVSRLMATPTPSVPQRAEKLLKLLHRMRPSAGAIVTIPREAIYTLFQYRDMPFTDPVHDKYAADFTLASSVCGSCWAEDYSEFSFILERYLCKQMQFLERVDNDYKTSQIHSLASSMGVS
jgi:hypothetical protein